ncbi:MAG TPA: RHS repeat-associated core domain-containing protein, partial [Polyangiaceae bacterium]
LVGSTGITATITTKFDAAGNMTRLGVVRPANKCAQMHNGTGMANPPCSQFYAYDYDEVGRLYRARRWDSSASSYNAETQDIAALGTAAIDLRYRYDASDQRVIKRVVAAEQRHTLYVFGSLEVHRTLYANNAYTISNASLVPYAMANGVRLARLHYSAASASPQAVLSGSPSLAFATNAPATLHVLLELGDHLGSTGTVLDKVTSELVEKTTYLPFGAREDDYRSDRWSAFREDYGFTGKEDVEVGLTYFGKRYLSAQLGRWVSADPLAVHVPGKADFNLYAYVSGAVLKNVDPLGLYDDDPTSAGTDTTGNTASTPPTPIAKPQAPQAEPVNDVAGTDRQNATGKPATYDPNAGRDVVKAAIVGAAATTLGSQIAVGVMAAMGSTGASDSGRKDLEIAQSQALDGMAIAPAAASLYRWLTAAEVSGTVPRATGRPAETLPDSSKVIPAGEVANAMGNGPAATAEAQGTVLYSAGPAARRSASAFAERTGARIAPDVPLSQATGVSRDLAMNAKGKVDVFLANTPKADSVYMCVERPILRENMVSYRVHLAIVSE